MFAIMNQNRALRTVAGIGAAVLGVVIFGAKVDLAAASMDVLGGEAVATDDDIFSRTDIATDTWRVRVRSFVYDNSNTVGGTLPPGLPGAGSPSLGQTLFVYLLENIGNGANPGMPLSTDRAVNSFTVANPSEPIFGPANIVIIAKAPGVVSGDLGVTGTRRDPRNYNDNVVNVDYDWVNQIFPLPATFELTINAYSIIYFLADSTYTDRQGLVTGAAQTDAQTILGPIVIPEPASLLLLLAGAAAIRRRMR